MELVPARCYRALRSRDPRFDGRFYVAVRTTGVYCRPICPAPTPRPENVRYFACAAAAQDAGFRACLRCRPETSPGTPAWQGTSTTVSRALRRIEGGVLDDGSVDDLALSLGVGSRHLRRLFLQHLGASPLAVAKTQRAHFARRLLHETDLPMTQIALASGFGSVRRFNAAIRDAFHSTPSELRRRRGRIDLTESRGELRLQLPYRAPFDWNALADFLALRAIPGVESVNRSSYRRTFETGESQGEIEVTPDESAPRLWLRVPASAASELAAVVERVRRIFDLSADPEAIATPLRRDPILARALRRHPGPRVPGCWDGFELAVRAILGQQVSVRGATTLAGRLVENWGTRIADPKDAGPTHLFPRPETLARVKVARIGIPAARADAIRSLARAVAAERLDLGGSAGLEESVAALTALPGIGPWTAHYIAMRAFGEPDAFPFGDLGLRHAIASNGRPASARELEQRAESWRPWRSYAAVALWSAGSTA